MKDYLWDKSGSDTEIERLENTLKQFRSEKDHTAPAIPVNEDRHGFKTPGSNSNWLFGLGAISFASIALFMFSLGIFQLTKIDDGPVAQNAPVTPKSSEKDLRVMNVPTIPPKVKKREIAAAKMREEKRYKVRRSRSNNRLRPRKYRQDARLPKKQRKGTKVVPEKEVIKLTREEKHALDQLMLGLSITSSNLKAVKEKVNGSD